MSIWSSASSYCVLYCRLYFAIGKNFDADNLINIAAVLFMWSTLPAFGAAAYIPAIVLERPLFTRCTPLLHPPRLAPLHEYAWAIAGNLI